jgi:hypothetical protein
MISTIQFHATPSFGFSARLTLDGFLSDALFGNAFHPLTARYGPLPNTISSLRQSSIDHTSTTFTVCDGNSAIKLNTMFGKEYTDSSAMTAVVANREAE